MPESFWAPEKLELIHGYAKTGTERELVELKLGDDPEKYNFINSAGFKYEADHVYECIKSGTPARIFIICLGKLESENVSHSFSLILAEILQDVRRQLNVVLPHDD